MNQIDETKQHQEFLYYKLLNRVARSFYLILKLLPPEIRDTVSLTYLLARITDNIIDESHGSYYQKVYFIYLLNNEITDNSDDQNKFAWKRMLSHLPSIFNDKELIEALPLCLHYFSLIPSADKKLAARALTTLFSGLKRDTDTFPYKHRQASFKTKVDLDNYLYETAGCFGEFWTDLCLLHWPQFSQLSSAENKAASIDFGKALLLTHILRKLPQDLRDNRCYLPAEQLSLSGINLIEIKNAPEKIFPVANFWRSQAYEYLASARKYIKNINIKSLRHALLLPYLISEQTLRLLEDDDYLHQNKKVKISSFDMKLIKMRAKISAMFPWLLF